MVAGPELERALSAGAPPTCGLSFRLAAEPARIGAAHAHAVIIALAGHMVDTPIGRNIPLDHAFPWHRLHGRDLLAGASRVAERRWRIQGARVYSGPFGKTDLFGLKIAVLGPLLARKAQARPRYSSFDQADSQVTPPNVATCHDPIKGPLTQIHASQTLVPQQFARSLCGPGPAWPFLALSIYAGFRALRRINTPDAQALARDFQRIAIDHTRRACDFALRRPKGQRQKKCSQK